MPFVITYKQLLDNTFMRAIHKLANAPITDIKTAYWAGRVTKDIFKKVEKVDKEYQKTIVGEFSEKDENGKIKLHPDNPARFWVPEEKEEGHKKAYDTFRNQKVEFAHNKLDFTKMQEVRFTPSDISALEDVFEEPNFD